MGAVDAWLILEYIKGIENEVHGGDVTKFTANEGLKAILFGLMLGGSGYFAGLALSVRAETIL